MTEQKYEEEKTFVLSELDDQETTKRGLGTWYISELIEQFRDDKEVMLACLKHHPASAAEASKALFEDKDFVSAVVRRHGLSLEHAHPDLQNDIEVVIKACNQDGHAMEFASKHIRSTPKLVAQCCGWSYTPLMYMDNAIPNDKSKLLEIMTCIISADNSASEATNTKIKVMHRASEEIRTFVGDGDPVEVLTKAVASEKLAAKLSNQLRPRIEPRQQSMKI